MNLKIRLVLLWAGLLLLWAILAGKLLSVYQESEKMMFVSVRNYSLLLAEQADGSFKAADLALQGVSNDPRFRQFLAAQRLGSPGGDREALNESLRAFLKTLAGAVNIFISDAEGKLLLGAISAPEGAHISDRDYFQQLVITTNSDTVFSETLKGRTSGKWSLQMARRLQSEDGEFLGVVGVSIGIEEQFSRFYGSIDWPEGTAISLWSRQQRLLMRYPMLADQIGKQSTGNLLGKAPHSWPGNGVEVGPSEFDGEIRARAVQTLGNYPISAIVAVPREHYFADWTSTLAGAGLFGGGAFLAASLLTVLVLRQKEHADAMARERKQHSEQLESYGKIVRSSQTALILLSPHLRCVIANPAVGKLLDCPGDELVGRPILDLFPPPARNTILREVQASLFGEHRKVQVEFEGAGGASFHTLETSPLLNSGAVSGVVLSLRDITVQCLAETALQQRETELKAIFDCEPDCVKVIDLEGRLRKINPAGIDLIEADNLDHALAIRIDELVISEDRAAYLAFSSQVLGGKSGVLQYRGTGLKGSPRHVESHAAPLRGPDGRIVGVLAISREVSRQKEIESRLESTLEEQQAMLDNGIVGLAKLRDRRFIWANSACENLLGHSVDELIGQSTEVFCPDQETNRRLLAAYAQLARGEIWRGKIPLRHRDGSLRWFQLGGSQLRNGDALWALVDVTAQQSAEEQLRLSHLAMEQSPDGIMITNTRPEIEYVNRAFTEMTGFAPGELLGKDPRLLNSGDTPPATFASLWQSLTAGQVWRGEFINRTKEGQSFISQEIITPVRQTGGEITHYLAIMKDVTEQRHLDEQLKSYRQNLEQMVLSRTAELDSLYNQAPCGYLSFDAEERITAINDTALGFLGYERSEVAGLLKVRDLLASYETERYEERQHVLLGLGVAHDQDYDFLCKDGSIFPALVSVEIVRDENGQFVAIRATFNDNRERQAKERQLNSLNLELAQRADEAIQESDAKSSFLANMSHEIRTPLNAIIGMSHLLRKTPLSDKQSEQLHKIESAGEHLLKVISDVLDMSKIEAGKLTLEEVPIAPNDLLPCVASLIEQRAIEKGLQIVTDSQPVSYWLKGDLTRLRQALLNLANNAVKFTDRGAVTLRMRVLQEVEGRVHLRFEVEDTGCGIPAPVLPSLFSAFQQADNSTTRKYGGTGLGLAITRQLAEMMGGRAGASSEVGKGSTFWFTICLERSVEIVKCAPGSQRLGAAMHHVPALETAGRRLLLVEDEPINQEILREILADSGFVVDVSDNGAEALQLARQGAYCLILMDMQMPVMDGLTATRHLRQIPALQKTPILAMTANAFAEDKAKCLEAGMNDFLTKPVDPEQFISTIVQWIRKLERR